MEANTETTEYVPGVHCPNCEGWGYTRATAADLRPSRETGKLVTVYQGSGCPTCRGTGLLS